MVHDPVHVPLGKKFKAGTFRKDHAEHRVGLLNAPFLAALHRIAVIDTGALDPVDAGLQSLRIAKFRASVRQDVFENRVRTYKSPYPFPDGQKQGVQPLLYNGSSGKQGSAFPLQKTWSGASSLTPWRNGPCPFRQREKAPGNRSRCITGL